VKAIHLAEAQYPDVSFAIGSYTEDDCRKVRHALMQADALMYEDKKDSINPRLQAALTGRTRLQVCDRSLDGKYAVNFKKL
jgi:hypothetical protein